MRDCLSFLNGRGSEADEVEVFEAFGGGLPVRSSLPRIGRQKGWATGPTRFQWDVFFVLVKNLSGLIDGGIAKCVES